MKRLLFVTDQFPFPAINGVTNKTANLLPLLARDHEITLLSFAAVPPVHDAMQRARDTCAHVELLTPQPRSLSRAALRMAPPFATRYQTPDARAAVRRITGRQRFDIAHFDTIGTMVLRDALAPGPMVTVGSPNDAYGLTLEGRHRVEGGAALRAAPLFGRSFERRLYRSFDYVHFVSPVDCAYANRLDRSIRAVTVPLGVDRTADTRHAEDPDTLIFVANLREGHGISLLRFLREAYPRIRALRPATKLVVAGAEPPDELLAMGRGDPSITITGYVEDLKLEMARGCVALSFSPQQGGMQTKVLLAMALGKSVVGVPQNFRAFEGAVDGVHFVAVPDIADFGAPVLRLLDDRAARRRIGSAARTLVEKRYTWDCVVERYMQFSVAARVQPR
jgi:polysaccharide biosynthesis protein PslH